MGIPLEGLRELTKILMLDGFVVVEMLTEWIVVLIKQLLMNQSF